MPSLNSARRIASVCAELPGAFKQSNASQADTDALFLRHKTHGDKRALNQLVQNYLPLVVSQCLSMKRRRPEFYRDDLDLLVSDGCLGLMKAIDYCRRSGIDGGPVFVSLARQSIKWYVQREVAKRSAFGTRAFYLRGQMQALRTKLMTTLGRVPTPDEVTKELNVVITNPLIQVGHVPEMKSIDADSGGEAQSLAETITDSTRSPEEILMNRELMRLVMRDMDPVDRRLFKMVLRGDTMESIGNVLDVSRQCVHQRLNGLLWTLQRRADLAEYLGTEPYATAAKKPANREIRSLQTGPGMGTLGKQGKLTRKMRAVG